LSNNIAIKAENLSKAYQLGEIGTGTISRDLERWYARIRGKEDPLLRIGETNDRSIKGVSDIVWSLKDINFEIEQGDAVGIIGRNGAGKSTLLKILSKVTAPTSGKITGIGRIASLLEVGTGFHPELSGRENIFLNGAILGMRKHEIKRKFDEIVEFSGVERYIDTPVKRYSSGMYVRLAFAVAAHLESEILIVDEVLAVGDAEFQKKCLGKMNAVSKGEGRTVLFVSHNMSAISKLCSKSLLLSNGQNAAFDTTEKIINIYNFKESEKQQITFDSGYVRFLKVSQEADLLIIECVYDGCSSFASPSFGFMIKDIYENKIFGSNPSIHPPSKKFTNSESGIIKATVEIPKLIDGKYYLTAWFGDGTQDYFYEENVLSFEVSMMSKTGFGIDGSELGSVVPQVIWHNEKK
jgi:lipopolysaccharide transport system ATP-binding protein